jgi:fermentation-respiration switch protein FrsA (DUF1100 family)
MSQPITFETVDGTRLAALFYKTDRDAPAPGIVMMNGFSGIKESLTAYAELFQAAGLNVLLYDNRGFGKSDAAVKLHVDPNQQVADLKDAITCLQEMEEVDAGRIGMFGTSLSGGHAIVAAATDRRIKCVVAQSPFISGHRSRHRLFSSDELRQLDKMFAEERRRLRKGEAHDMLPVMSENDELMCLPPKVSARFMERSFADAPGWKNEVTLQSLENFLNYEPGAYLPYVSPTPLLMIIGTRDVICYADLGLEGYERALEPKKLVTVPSGHWAVYYPPLFETTGSAARDWFADHLLADS